MSRRARLEGLFLAFVFATLGLWLRGSLAGWVFGAGALATGAWLAWDLLMARRCDVRAQVMQELHVSILIRGWDGSRITVRDPQGNEHALSEWVQPWIGEDLGVKYPEHFPTASHVLQAGEYAVLLRGPGRLRRRHEVMRCSCPFRIPDGEPGWFVRWEGIHVGGGDQVTIFVQAGREARQLRGLQCDVWSPGQATDDRPARAMFADDSPHYLIPQATYPEHFEGGSVLRKGVYRGEWTAWSPASPVGAEGRRTLVRRFAFEWPNLEAMDTEGS